MPVTLVKTRWNAGQLEFLDSSGNVIATWDGTNGLLDVESSKLAINGTAVSASAEEINRAADVSGRIVNATAATLALTQATHDGKVVTLNRAAGVAVTLPAATGSGAKFHLVVGTTVTSNTTTVKVTGDDTMTGTALNASDGGDTTVMFETAAASDTITLDGTTRGGIKGDSIELIDIAADLWWVRVVGSATGAEATPFSATVS